MTLQPWWERCPERLEYEISALDAAGILWQRDEQAAARGVMQFQLTVTHEGRDLPLVVRFPDLYPYFRFEVYAPTLELPYHQNPFENNLCLIGRRTHYWDTTDTVAGLLQVQLSRVIESAQSSDAAAIAGVEQEQAEPFSNYYNYAPSMIIVQSDWTIGLEHPGGLLTIGSVSPSGASPPMLVRGAVLKLSDARGAQILAVDNAWRSSFPGPELTARWVRIDKPVRESNPGAFLRHLFRIHPEVEDAPVNRVNSGWLKIWGVLFPEETAWRRVGEGWVFVCAYDPKRANLRNSRSRQPTSKKRRKRGRKGSRR